MWTLFFFLVKGIAGNPKDHYKYKIRHCVKNKPVNHTSLHYPPKRNPFKEHPWRECACEAGEPSSLGMLLNSCYMEMDAHRCVCACAPQGCFSPRNTSNRRNIGMASHQCAHACGQSNFSSHWTRPGTSHTGTVCHLCGHGRATVNHSWKWMQMGMFDTWRVSHQYACTCALPSLVSRQMHRSTGRRRTSSPLCESACAQPSVAREWWSRDRVRSTGCSRLHGEKLHPSDDRQPQCWSFLQALPGYICCLKSCWRCRGSGTWLEQ